jgi:hypothetical protein
MRETVLPGPDALRWHVWQSYRDSRYLFRGEHKDWGSTYSSLDRLQASKVMPQRQWEVFDSRLLHIVMVLDIVINAKPVFSSANAVTDYNRPESLRGERDRLAPEHLVYATLQHYGIPSSFIDLSENLETALFFASDTTNLETDIAIMFVVDSKHDEIAKRLARMPDSELYLRSRHARQAAHGLCLRLGSGARDADYAKKEDFRLLGGVVEKITFPWPTDDRARFNMQHHKPLLSTVDDKLALQVFQACEHGLDKETFEAIRVDEIFSRVRNTIADYHTRENG